MIAPSTDIRLLKTPIEIDESNQLTFANVNTQYNYFNSLPCLYLDNATYQRKDNVIRYPLADNLSFDDIIKYNYCMYKNDAYTDKIFYAFVRNIRYVNDGMAEITIETDVFQTWQFDVQYKSSFIERKHVTDDTLGKNTIPEGLETGEYMYQDTDFGTGSTGGWDTTFSSCRLVFAMSDNGYDFASPAGNRQYAGVFSGLRYYAMKTYEDGQKYIEALQRLAGGKIDGLYAMFLAPDDLLGINANTSWWQCPSSQDPVWEMVEVPYSSTISHLTQCHIYDGRKLGYNYTPVNNKTLVYPYRYIVVSNNAGQSHIYKYEYFKNNNSTNNYICEWGVDGALSIGCSIKLYPKLYNNPNVVIEGDLGHNYLEGLDCYKLPTCSWLTDPFLNWLSTNAVNLGIGTTLQVGSMIAGTALMAANPVLGGGMVLSGATGIGETLKSSVEHSLEPETAKGGGNQGELLFKRGFTCYCLSIRDEYAKIIDDYFTCYGYKVNTFEVPNINTRTYWNYIKTIDVNLLGDIPQEDLQKLKNIFNNGCTFWHDPEHFLDYSLSNTIVS